MNDAIKIQERIATTLGDLIIRNISAETALETATEKLQALEKANMDSGQDLVAPKK